MIKISIDIDRNINVDKNVNIDKNINIDKVIKCFVFPTPPPPTLLPAP